VLNTIEARHLDEINKSKTQKEIITWNLTDINKNGDHNSLRKIFRVPKKTKQEETRKENKEKTNQERSVNHRFEETWIT
jgi:hypothetical protein